ncbi:MAG: Holliday junction resolvase RuvX [Burkholderiales bacterium]
MLIEAGPGDRVSGATNHPLRGTVLAFDFGERRIGVAVGELETGIAHPVETIDAIANESKFARIALLIREWRPVLLVVGLPLAMDGSEHRMTGLARKFANRLRGRFAIETFLVDERLTSAAAESDARSSGVKRRKIKQHVDPLAAQQILDSYFRDKHVVA